MRGIKRAITYVIGSLFLKEAGVAMRAIRGLFRKKDYIRCPIEVLYFLKGGNLFLAINAFPFLAEKRLLF